MAKEEAVFQAQIAEGKCNLIHQLLEEYDIQISEDIQDTLKDLMGKTIKKMIEAEMKQHFRYENQNVLTTIIIAIAMNTNEKTAVMVHEYRSSAKLSIGFLTAI